MALCDPVADMLTRIRNGYMAEADIVEMPHSKLKGDITKMLKKEGYINDYVVEGGVKKILRIYLKYTADREAAIRGIKRESKPGLRRYVSADSIPRIIGGLGVAVLSTSSGIMSGKEAKKQGIGGEFVCSVW